MLLLFTLGLFSAWAALFGFLPPGDQPRCPGGAELRGTKCCYANRELSRQKAREWEFLVKKALQIHSPDTTFPFPPWSYKEFIFEGCLTKAESFCGLVVNVAVLVVGLDLFQH